MGYAEIALVALKLVFLGVTKWFERDAERKKKLEEAEKMVKAGLKDRDRSAVTLGFARARRL